MKLSVTMEIALSKAVFLYSAARMPRIRAIGTAIAAETAARKSVLEKRQPIISAMGRPPAREFPRSPCRKLPSQSTYLTWGGRSSLSSALNAATVAGVASCPRMASARSPGKASTPMKISIEITMMVANPSSSRLNMSSKIFFIKPPIYLNY